MVIIDIERLRCEYAADRRAVARCATEYGVSIQTVYKRMKQAGIRLRVGGETTKGTQARENNPNWKNGTTVRKDGYILEYVDGKQFFQHRLIAEKMLGRPLDATECVHHKNGNPSDNRPENLEVMPSHAAHMKEHCQPEVMSERGKLGNAKRWGIASLRARSLPDVK